ncbi:chaperone protein dnaJ C76, chloroplastic [Cornus florida]|uniref:chaperone protein dnaJ C76, chloroplastic n=1 Tax=Cornus florida TaxID=4283 RepID=UPI00289EC53A|nr:chaperone protein dnaJ C76, chloroplastic [Cornus florida]
MLSPSFPLSAPFSSTITTNPNPKTFSFHAETLRKPSNISLTCRASTSSSSSSITDFDLYDLLGIDSSSDQSKIKTAYRALQKRCHPDIAGPAGHDMAIILNDAYAVLSEPNSRLAYDKEHAKMAELLGYTGKPIYSVWFGSENEERAVFVDEVKCVGCLKCALFAEKTFAVESVYGRARVVAQWADPEDKIQEAIETCPVDCISVVERSNLAALEFLMSKQPRGNVRVGAGNAVGTRVSNIFVDVEKFQSRFQDVMDKGSIKQSKESDDGRESRISAFQAIRAISNWLYWQSPSSAGGASTQTPQNLIHIARKSTEPDIKKLRDAVAARKQARQNVKRISGISSSYLNEEYWTPSTLILPEPTNDNAGSRAHASESSPPKEPNQANNNKEFIARKRTPSSPFTWAVPMGAATIAAVLARLQIEEASTGGLEEHIGGSFALGIVNSSWLPVILAGVTWYLIGMYTVELVESIRSKLGERKE